jgi:ABC-type bacteriocin/lantibiotic exporter with double-glycine peptidase domain
MSRDPMTQANETGARKKIFRIFRISILELAVILAIVGTLFYILSKPFYDSKYRAAETHLKHRLSVERSALQIKPQFESHTCGYLALAAVYESFGLDERKADLRFRLGVDEPATPVSAEDTTGTLHPDMFRVVSQDGFKFTVVDLEGKYAMTQTTNHLEQHRPALALITRRENNRLHWVVLTEYQDGSVKVADSLRPGEMYTEELGSFLRECVVSMVLLETRTDREKPPSVSRAHLNGLDEMVKVYARLRKRGKAIE